jgi:hypothetical protein
VVAGEVAAHPPFDAGAQDRNPAGIEQDGGGWKGHVEPQIMLECDHRDRAPEGERADDGGGNRQGHGQPRQREGGESQQQDGGDVPTPQAGVLEDLAGHKIAGDRRQHLDAGHGLAEGRDEIVAEPQSGHAQQNDMASDRRGRHAILEQIAEGEGGHGAGRAVEVDRQVQPAVELQLPLAEDQAAFELQGDLARRQAERAARQFDREAGSKTRRRRWPPACSEGYRHCRPAY